MRKNGHLALMCSLLLSCPAAAVAGDSVFDYDDYAAVLASYVDDTGMVAYSKLQSSRQKLDLFTDAMAYLDPDIYQKWTANEKLAFWLNAYNALTLKVIIDNYPIKSSFFKSMAFPKNSIRQIGGVWDKIKFAVMGKTVTLGHIEHEILRKDFSEPKIHMAMVCAAMGCPPLRNEPFVAERIDEQLDDQAKKFLATKIRFRFDSSKAIVYLSPIFKWFGEDFTKAVKDKDSSRYSRIDRAVLDFVKKYSGPDQPFLWPSERKYAIKYLDYDWSLNEQKGSESKGK